MKFFGEDIDPQRRDLLIALLASGAFIPTMSAAALLGNVPKPLRGRSIYLLNGEVKVDGAAADISTPITSGSLVETGPSSKVIFVVDKDAFILRDNSRVQLTPPVDDGVVVETLRLFTGKLLSVFGKRRHRLRTSTATIGIRGTGLYAEADQEKSYICTCYGVVDIASANDPSQTQTVESTHHDKPVYVLATGANAIKKAPFINHTDDELALIETLVGRETPFPIDPGEARGRSRSY
ncbi:MAG: hypothetical protein AAF384_05060 [Pseudomonadota bacterium]